MSNVAGNTIQGVASSAGQTVQGIASSATNLLSSPVVIIGVGIVLLAQEIRVKNKVNSSYVLHVISNYPIIFSRGIKRATIVHYLYVGS